jgi:hypothetical protein
MYLKEILCAIFGKGGNVSKKCFKLFFPVKMAETIENRNGQPSPDIRCRPGFKSISISVLSQF